VTHADGDRASFRELVRVSYVFNLDGSRLQKGTPYNQATDDRAPLTERDDILVAVVCSGHRFVTFADRDQGVGRAAYVDRAARDCVKDRLQIGR
jgi:hypothetical protein